MSSNLGVYGDLTAIKLQEKHALSSEIEANKLAIKALKK
jgi:hypothetical protein